MLSNIVAKNGGGIVPLGGSTEQLGGRKGYGYGMIAELFSSILSLGVTYLGLDFKEYFGGYEAPAEFAGFSGNY